MAIKFSTEKKQKINNKIQKLTNSILQEKNKEQPNKTNMENRQNQINDKNKSNKRIKPNKRKKRKEQ